jgi:DNA-binding NarL/FixJ family response regulator
VGVEPTIREALGPEDEGISLNGSAVLLDEHPLWLAALDALLVSRGLRVVGKATSPEEALRLVASTKPDTLIACLDFPGRSMAGIELLRRVRARSRDVRIVAFSANHDPFHVRAAVAAGADAYLPKTTAPSVVVETVRDCLVGGTACACDPQLLAEEENEPTLTARELEIVHLAARGYTNAQIAERLWVTTWTVKFHLVNVYRKLGVSNRTQAARYLFEQGLAAPQRSA